jgi:PilZ domain
MLPQASSRSGTRRFNSRIQTSDGVWVYWYCNGRAETSRVQDVGLGGVFLETVGACPVGAKAELHFLVQEGQIRTQAEVRHVAKGRGIGLKFTAVKDEDRPALVSLMRRARIAGH